ncbi:MAG TPA: glycosyl hydrolase family 18 protein [Mycobacteriales bacterium]|jgi:spore germination protein YaaH|nr:glycosyl hydrolase family 18 protein [Mycobacteriales bacterium]
MTRPWRTVAVAALVALAAAPAPAQAATRRTVSGWLPYWSQSNNLQHFAANADLFRAVSPFWYRADGSTTVYAQPGAEDATVLRTARSKGVPVVPTVTESMNAKDMAAILGMASRRTAHADRLIRIVDVHGFAGIDLDYEQFVVTTDQTVAATNKSGFSALVKELCGKLRARGKQCVITVHARTDDAMQASYRPTHAVGVFDFAVIARYATTMRIMTYGQHYPSGKTAGPVAGLPWVEAVAKYTVSKVGSYRSRVELGVAQVGYDWPSTGVKATTYTFAQAVAKLRAVGSPRMWSSTEQAPYFNYRSADGVGHRVWYDDAQSGAIRARLALRYGFAGTALWYPGIEDPNLWSPLRSMSQA